MKSSDEVVSTEQLVVELDAMLKAKERNRLEHPFVMAVQSGEATENQIAGWLHQFSSWADPSNKLFGVMYSNCPDDDLRDMILENLLEEERGMSSGLKGHMELIGMTLKELGWTDDRRQQENLQYQSWALRHWLEVVMRNRPFVQSICAVSFSMERINPYVFHKLEQGLRAHYNLSDEALLTFSVHASDVEEEHGTLGQTAMDRYARTVRDQNDVRFAVQHTGDLYYAQYDVWRASKDATSSRVHNTEHSQNGSVRR